jgi:hypothetical protein
MIPAPGEDRHMDNKTNPEWKPKYEGWLVSPNILKRSLAVLGHAYLAMFLLYIPFIILGMLAAGVGALLG